MKVLRFTVYLLITFLFSSAIYGQEIKLQHKYKTEKSKMIRVDKPVMVKTFDGTKLKGEASVNEAGKLTIDGTVVIPDEVMTLSGFVMRNSKEKAIGLGLSIGAGIIALPALYYILGGIAWGIPNGIFVGATVLVFDLFLAYAGISMMGIYPRKFSTMNWNVLISSNTDNSTRNIPLPKPFD